MMATFLTTMRRSLVGLALLALLALVSGGGAARAASTVAVPLNGASYTDLGAGPMILGASGGNVVYQVSDAQPTLGSQGLVESFGAPPVALNGAAHVWALAAGSHGGVVSAIVISGAGVVASGAVVSGSVSVSNLPSTQAVTESGTWALTPTLTTVSTLTLTGTTTAYASGQLVASNATAASVANPSFSMPSTGGAIPRLRLQSTDTTATAWASASVQIDLWSAPPTWANGDHAAWKPATGSGNHIASYSCSFSSTVWGDGLATECTPNQGNYASHVSGTVYWSVQALSGSGVLGGGKALNLVAELN